MSAPPSEVEPGPRTRHLIAFLLRAGLGMNLLNSGFVGYLGANRGFGTFAGMPAPMPIDPLMQAFPLVQIVLGLALVLGLFTTAAAVAAGVFILLAPLAQMLFLLVTDATGFPAANPRLLALNTVLTGTTNQLLLVAAILWFSTSASNPWSLDRLFFAPRGRAIEPPAPGPIVPASEDDPPGDRPPAPRPGERAAKFIGRREG